MHATGVLSQRLVLQVVHTERLVTENCRCDLSPSVSRPLAPFKRTQGVNTSVKSSSIVQCFPRDSKHQRVDTRVLPTAVLHCVFLKCSPQQFFADNFQQWLRSYLRETQCNTCLDATVVSTLWCFGIPRGTLNT